MTLRLTPDMLAAGYDFLRECQPFRGWKLPPSDDVEFHVIATPKLFADFTVEKGVPVIRVSTAKNGHTMTVLAALAHEICHLRQHMIGAKDAHGASFKAMAKAVCKHHGFDPKTF